MDSDLLVVVGASGAGRRAVDIAMDMLDSAAQVPFSRVAVVDDRPSTDDLRLLREQGTPYLGTTASYLNTCPATHFTVGIGDLDARARIAGDFVSLGHTPTTLVAPTARVSRTARLGRGCVISPGVDLSANVNLGEFVHVMANAAVSHDVTVGEFVNINPGAVLAGRVQVRRASTIGAGAVVIQGLHVGTRSVVGAGAVVVHNVSNDCIVKGVPAR